MLIDTHCHLTYPGLIENVGEVLSRARVAGVGRFITIGTSIGDHPRAVGLTHTHEGVYAALGIHPHHAAETEEGYEGFLENRVVSEQRVLAIGECGLDYHHQYAPKLMQRGVFLNQLEIARKLEVPVILHVRDAHKDAAAIMEDFPELRFVVHCFTGTKEECEKWVGMGAYIGITGIVTYKNAADVAEAAKGIPADRLLVETDAPYLSPEPVRSVKTNEPAHVAHTAKFLAELRGVAYSDLEKQTTENAIALFGERLAR